MCGTMGQYGTISVTAPSGSLQGHLPTTPVPPLRHRVFHGLPCSLSHRVRGPSHGTQQHLETLIYGYVLDLLARRGAVSSLEEEYLRQFDVLGDDFRGLVLSVSTAQLFDQIIDQVFGTITETATPPIFGDPDDWRSNSLEFLRRRHVRLGDAIRTFREPVRVLAKLIHGNATTSTASFLAAVHASFYDIGYNPKLHAHLLALVDQLSAGQADYEQHVERKLGRIPQLVQHPSDYHPSFNVCADSNGSQLKPALDVANWMMRHAQGVVKTI